MSIKDVRVGVILAAGLGTRMRPLTYIMPKPMLPLGTKPILQHIIEWMRDNGIEEIYVLTSYLSKFIESYFGDGSEFGVKIRYIRSDRPLGSGGQLKIAEPYVHETFVLSYCDVVTNLKLRDVIDFHFRKGAIVTMVLTRYREKLRFGHIVLDEDMKVIEWREKPEIEMLINTGIYVFEPIIFRYINDGEVVGMDEVVTRVMRNSGKVYGYIADDAEFIDIGDYNSYIKACDEYIKKFGRI